MASDTKAETKAVVASKKGKAERTFTIVYIPADANRSMEEWKVVEPKGREVECLIDRIKAFWNEQAQKSLTEEEKVEQRRVMREQVAKAHPSAVLTDEVIQSLLNMNMVDNVPLLLNTKKNNFIAVSMYVDDQGMMKKLPHNPRASAITEVVGRVTNVLGDAWIARLFDDENDFKRLDFTLAEISSDAEWVKQARASNASAPSQSGTNVQEMFSNMGKNLPKKGYKGSGSDAPAKVVSRKCASPSCGALNTKSLRCGGCQSVYYCNKDCQKNDWTRHKPTCKKPVAAAAVASPATPSDAAPAPSKK